MLNQFDVPAYPHTRISAYPHIRIPAYPRFPPNPTVLGQVDLGGQDGNVARTRIRDETSETDHTQKRRFHHGAICRTIKALAILRCLYGSEGVLLGVVIRKCETPTINISQEKGHGQTVKFKVPAHFCLLFKDSAQLPKFFTTQIHILVAAAQVIAIFRVFYVSEPGYCIFLFYV